MPVTSPCSWVIASQKGNRCLEYLCGHSSPSLLRQRVTHFFVLELWGDAGILAFAAVFCLRPLESFPSHL